jgi:hypothetical protein
MEKEPKNVEGCETDINIVDQPINGETQWLDLFIDYNPTFFINWFK